MTTCYATSTCIPGQLRDPEFKQKLTQMASTSEILVPNCEGYYIPYAPTDAEALSVPLHARHSSFIDDRLSR